jgi:hypothetical protein
MTRLTNRRGVAHERTIELEQELSLREGEVVEVMILRTMQPLLDKLPPGEGI